ncbi:hypothetical protein [Thalassospira sp.]|uniref:hypothetical protein n=1 Tax=Thalassospira sp. TaxID=1912094 RepID=UPI0025803B6D|nr:hypothetical protein [Thalassospira sp.]
MTFERTHEHEIDVRTESDHVSHLHLHYSTTRTKPMQTKHSQLFSTHTYPTQKKSKDILSRSPLSHPHVSLLGASQRNSKTVILLYFLRHTHQKNQKERRQRKWITVFSTTHILLSLQQQKFHTQKKRAFFVLIIIIIIIITTPPPPQRSFLFLQQSRFSQVSQDQNFLLNLQNKRLMMMSMIMSMIFVVVTNAQPPYPGPDYLHPKIHHSPNCLHEGGWRTFFVDSPFRKRRFLK